MLAYALRRVLQAVLTVLLITLVTFVVAKAAPGGPFGLDDPDFAARIPQEMRDQYRRLYGLDRPPHVQYLRWLARLSVGDLGNSYTYRNETVRQVLARTWPRTVVLGLEAGALALLLGVPLGLGAAARCGRWPDQAVRVLAVLGGALPVYVLAAVCVLVFAIELHWLPLTPATGGNRSPAPVLVLAAGPLATIIRFTRTSALDALSSDYVRTAYAKGLGSRAVLLRHVLKNSLLPVLTLAGPLTAQLLTGSFFVETIFNLPGVAAALSFAAADRDYPLIMAGALLSACLIVLLNLAVDLSYRLLDPRIRIGASP